MCEPINPAPPVTNARFILLQRRLCQTPFYPRRLAQAPLQQIQPLPGDKFAQKLLRVRRDICWCYVGQQFIAQSL